MPIGVPRISEPWEWVRERTCTRCGESKPWALFSPKQYWPDGTVRNVQSWCRECRQAHPGYREAQRRWRRRNYARRLQVKREWRRDRRAALLAEQHRDVQLPVEPFMAWCAERVVELGSLQALGECLPIGERRLRAIRDQRTVGIDIVDRCAVALGFHLTDIYPELAVAGVPGDREAVTA